MNAAISQLEVDLEVLKTNEPINRARGDIEQANLEARNAYEIECALQVLRDYEDKNSEFISK